MDTAQQSLSLSPPPPCWFYCSLTFPVTLTLHLGAPAVFSQCSEITPCWSAGGCYRKLVIVCVCVCVFEAKLRLTLSLCLYDDRCTVCNSIMTRLERSSTEFYKEGGDTTSQTDQPKTCREIVFLSSKLLLFELPFYLFFLQVFIFQIHFFFSFCKWEMAPNWTNLGFFYQKLELFSILNFVFPACVSN